MKCDRDWAGPCGCTGIVNSLSTSASLGRRADRNTAWVVVVERFLMVEEQVDSSRLEW